MFWMGHWIQNKKYSQAGNSEGLKGNSEGLKGSALSMHKHEKIIWLAAWMQKHNMYKAGKSENLKISPTPTLLTECPNYKNRMPTPEKSGYITFNQ